MEYAQTAIKIIVTCNGSSACSQHRSGQSKVLRVGDLEILRTAFDQFGALPHKLQRAGFVRHRIASRVQGRLQGTDAEHLRRLGQPLVTAVHGGGNAAALLLLQGVRQLQSQQATHRIVLARVNQPVHIGGGDQAARGIVHQHPVLRVSTLLQQGRKTIKNAASARGTSASSYKNRSTLRRLGSVKKRVPRRHHHLNTRQPLHRRQGLEGVQHHGLAAQHGVLLGACRTGAAAVARTRHQAPKTYMKRRV